MKHQHGWMRIIGTLWSQVLGVHPRAAYAGKVEVIALGERDLKRCRDQLDLRVHLPHFGQTAVPEDVKILRPGVASLVFVELFQGHVKHQGHGCPPLMEICR